MYKTLLFAAFLLAAQTQAFAKHAKGKVNANGIPLANVVITDGVHFSKTDPNGLFSFEIEKDAEFLYIFTPSGYAAPFDSGAPQFYKRLKDETGDLVFNLKKLPFTTENYALIAIADPQTKTRKHFDRFVKESVPDIEKTVTEYLGEQTNVVGIALGDIMWDNLPLFNEYKKVIGGLKVPFYAVIGNHDYDMEISDDYASTAEYREHFGPTDYGFNLGNQYYIVLDNIIYEGNKKYQTDFTKEQLQWVKSYLQYVPKNADVIFAMHAPYVYQNEGLGIEHGPELLDICKDYKVQFMSGHTHLNANTEVAPNVIEHNIGALCGTWWTSEVCRDGTPNGYAVFEGSNKSFKWYHKSVGKSKDYQLKVFDRGLVTTQSNAVVAKVWNWDKEWKVEWYEDDQYMGPMQNISAFDPEYLRYLQIKKEHDNKEVPNYKKPFKSHFFFSAVPSLNAKTVRVVATDRFGNSFESSIKISTPKI